MITLSRVQNTVKKNAAAEWVPAMGQWKATIKLGSEVCCYGASYTDALYNLAYRIYNSPALMKQFDKDYSLIATTRQ